MTFQSRKKNLWEEWVYVLDLFISWGTWEEAVRKRQRTYKKWCIRQSFQAWRSLGDDDFDLVDKSMNLRVGLAEFKFWFHNLTSWVTLGSFTFVCLSVSICKMEPIKIPAQRVVVRISDHMLESTQNNAWNTAMIQELLMMPNVIEDSMLMRRKQRSFIVFCKGR